MRNRFWLLIILFISAVFIFSTGRVLAMSSENYQIEKDSINFGGTDDGASANYNLDDTMGEIASGDSDSASYGLSAGYRTSDGEMPTLSFSISSNVVNLGTLSPAAVSSASIIATTTTNSINGYSVSIIEDGNLRTEGGAVINDVSDGLINSGSSEYGIRTSGVNGLYNSSDTAITGTLKSVASENGSALNDSFMIYFRVAISPATAAGDYQHRVTFICTGIF